jgi:hypothetical protein
VQILFNTQTFALNYTAISDYNKYEKSIVFLILQYQMHLKAALKTLAIRDFDFGGGISWRIRSEDRRGGHR